MTHGDDAPAALPIADYALIGDGLSAALVGRNGSIDWLCWPNFDGDACFAALLGTPRNGRWLVAPRDGGTAATRRYRGDTMVVETVFETPSGAVAVIDFMPVGEDHRSVVRIVEGRRGRVAMGFKLSLRFDYGSLTPALRPIAEGHGIEAVAGRHRATLRGDVPLDEVGRNAEAAFTIRAGERARFVLTWSESHLAAPDPVDADEALRRTKAYWTAWSGRCRYVGRWREPVMRSLLTLKALSFTPTGAIVAAPTTSLPEQLGGTRNWDYRFCWLRDAALTVSALIAAGYGEEAEAWGAWLLRAVAGDPEAVQIMYGIHGERRLHEWSPAWLRGYGGASPVRIGNEAWTQRQLDTHGEVAAALHVARRRGLKGTDAAWQTQVWFVRYVEQAWEQPDEGIWEMRSGRRHYTHSKVMAWASVDCAIRDAEAFGFPAPLKRWRALRDHMHDVICRRGFSAQRNSFTQSFESAEVDASLLLLVRTGFLPADDARMLGTVRAIEADLISDGLVKRYRTEGGGDGLPPGEGAFLPCSFWLADVYALQGRRDDAVRLFERLLELCNDVGLLSEEYDTGAGCQVGNFPQAYSHLSLIATAMDLDGAGAG